MFWRQYVPSKALWDPAAGIALATQRWHAAEVACGGEGVLVCGISGSGWEEACHWALFVIRDGCIPCDPHSI